MKKMLAAGLPILLIALALNIAGSTGVQAGTKDMAAGKRDKFKDDNVESMRDVFARRETEEKEYRETMLANSNKSVELLEQIKQLLIELNRKKSN